MTFTYWSKGKIKQTKTKYPDSTTTTNYNKKGMETEVTFVSKDGSKTTVKKTNIKYNKKGDVTDCTSTRTAPDGSKSVTTVKNTYSYNKKGLPTKEIRSRTTKEGSKVTETDKTTYKYTYNKKGNVTKMTYSSTYKSEYYNSSDSGTYKYKYKTVKVPKKYWKAIEASN